MKLVTFRHDDGVPEPGVVVGDRVVGLSAAGFSTALGVIEHWASARESIQSYIDGGHATNVYPLSGVDLLAPVPRPPKVICVGLNYRDHAIESNMEIPALPTVFSKFSHTVIGPGDEIVLPKNTEKPDYEAEFAVVIGKTAKRVSAGDWEDYVFGYTCVNDVSARDFQLATTQWLMGKTCDTFCPMGPWIVTTDEIADPHALNISMTINGEILQSSNTRELIFRVPELIEFISARMTLEPGDVISTGTPAGVGFGFKPPRWLKPGDECVIAIQGIGELRNPVVLES